MSIMDTLDWRAPANDSAHLRCLVCDAGLPGGRRKYCSMQCKDRRPRKRDRPNGHATGPDRTCEHCGAIFKRRRGKKNAARFCSRECGVASRRAPTVSDDLRVIAESFAVSVKVARCVCRQCGLRFAGVALSNRFCSDECNATYTRAKYEAANDNGRDRSPRPCSVCGNVFEPTYGDKRRKFCSPACNKRSDEAKASRLAAKMRRRAAKVEAVNPIKVFDRDQWRCRLCGVRTPKRLRGTYEDRAPELDHIIPISMGGEHSYRNVQCACRKCNHAKGATPMGQMLLFG